MPSTWIWGFTGSWTASPWRTCRLSNVFAGETTSSTTFVAAADLEYEVIFNSDGFLAVEMEGS